MYFSQASGYVNLGLSAFIALITCIKPWEVEEVWGREMGSRHKESDLKGTNCRSQSRGGAGGARGTGWRSEKRDWSKHSNCSVTKSNFVSCSIPRSMSIFHRPSIDTSSWQLLCYSLCIFALCQTQCVSCIKFPWNFSSGLSSTRLSRRGIDGWYNG